MIRINGYKLSGYLIHIFILEVLPKLFFFKIKENG